MRSWIERHLPWYDAEQAAERDARTERIQRRSEIARLRAERVIAEYRRAEERQDAAAERLIDEVQR